MSPPAAPGSADPVPARQPALRAGAAARSTGVLQAMCALFLRDLRITLRRRVDAGAALVFFVIVVSLFPLGVGADPSLLRELAPGAIWVAALLAAMLTLPRLFADDRRDGTLDELLLAAAPLPLLVAARVAAHWLGSGLLLALLSPLLALQFDLGARASVVLLVSLLLGTPLLSLVGAVAAALTLDARGGGVLLALLVLPLYVPVLVFGAASVQAAAAGLAVSAHFSLLGALLVAALFLAPWATAAALRIAVE